MLSSLLTLSSVAAASELALYWGQNSAGNEAPLGTYCQTTPGDIYIISFINDFGSNREMGMNIHGYYNYIQNTHLLEASALGKEIQTCQQLGKKVFISLGGAVGDYGFDNDSDAESVATDLWNHFAGGQSDIRPFGPDVKLDGFDIDPENKIGASSYTALVNKLNQLYTTDSSKQYYVSGSPQCVYPDASVGDAIANAHFDYLFVQFYNNYCSLSANEFNFNTWQNFASSQSPNKNVKVLAGLAGAPSAAGSGYATIEQIQARYPELVAYPNFGGFSVWDASQANSNVINGKSFAQYLEDLIHPPAPQTTAAASTSAAAAASTEAASTASAAGPYANSSAPVQYTTVTGTYLTTVPCTTLATPASGTPYETVGVTTAWQTYTSTIPCDTPVPATNTAPAASAAPSAPGAPGAPAADVTSTVKHYQTVTVQKTQTISIAPTASAPAAGVPTTVINGTVYELTTTTRTHTVNLCTC